MTNHDCESIPINLITGICAEIQESQSLGCGDLICDWRTHSVTR